MIAIWKIIKGGGWMVAPFVLSTILIMNVFSVTPKKNKIEELNSEIVEQKNANSELGIQIVKLIKSDSLKTAQVNDIQLVVKEQLIRQKQIQAEANFFKDQIAKRDTLIDNISKKTAVITKKYKWDKDPNGTGLFKGKTWVLQDSTLTFGLKIK